MNFKIPKFYVGDDSDGISIFDGKIHVVIDGEIHVLDSDLYTEEDVRCMQLIAEYAKSVDQLKNIYRKLTDIEAKSLRKQKENCISEIKNKFINKLDKMCIKCGLDTLDELEKIHPKLSEMLHIFAKRKISTILAIYANNPLKCSHSLANNKLDSFIFWIFILTLMEYVYTVDVALYESWENHRIREGFNTPFSSDDMIYRSDRISRRDPSTRRFHFISHKISCEMIENLPYFSEARDNISDAMDDVFKFNGNNYFFTKEDLSWPIIKTFSVDLDKIVDSKGKAIEIEDILGRDDAYFNLAKTQLINRGDDVVTVADLHEFTFGFYKTILNRIETPEGEEGVPFEKTVQMLFSLLLGECEIYSGKNFVSAVNQPNLQVDLIAKKNDYLIIGECKNKGRYYNPEAGVKHTEEDIINEGIKQVSRCRKSLLHSTGIIRIEAESNFSSYKKDINYIIPIVVHNHEYVFPGYKILEDDELRGDEYGVHHFSLEGLYIALFTCGNVDNLLNYLRFRREYIDHHRSKLFGSTILNELDICVSFVGGGYETYALNGIYKLVSCVINDRFNFYDLSRREWVEFLKSIYYAEDSKSPYWNSLTGSISNIFRFIYENYYEGNKKPRSELNGYAKSILSSIEIFAPISAEYVDLNDRNLLYKLLSLNYISFKI